MKPEPGAATARRLLIRGRVQGVGYRWAMVEQARRLGVTGWVRNRHDATVEAMVAGTAEQVERLVAWAREGPPAAEVSAVEVSEGRGVFSGFEPWPTA